MSKDGQKDVAFSRRTESWCNYSGFGLGKVESIIRCLPLTFELCFSLLLHTIHSIEQLIESLNCLLVFFSQQNYYNY